MAETENGVKLAGSELDRVLKGARLQSTPGTKKP
jgi:hypothetical protein